MNTPEINRPESESQTGNHLWNYVKKLFDLHGGTDEPLTVAYIKENIAFRGETLWMLVFSILICSVGLNINSTAVIIGAMLISPLMGPITGAGLAIGINDWDTLKLSLVNLSVAVVVSVVTSAAYFFITPLTIAQSELLARTFPTLFDVLIAAFGGATGIIAVTRKEKSTAIPGVAIATALMPPLCTAGYGLANGLIVEYFLGALYLFIINSVFICLAAVVFLRFWHFKKKEFMNEEKERRVRRYIMIVALVTIIPSLFTVYRLVQETVFNTRANRFIAEQVETPTRRVAIKSVNYSVFSQDPSSIEVWTMGDALPGEQEAALQLKLVDYNLGGTNLVVHQGERFDSEALRNQIQAGLFDEIIKKSDQTLETKERLIADLSEEINRLRKYQQPVSDIAEELRTHHEGLLEFAYSMMVNRNLGAPAADSTGKILLDTLPTVVLDWRRLPRNAQQEDIRAFLLKRMKVDTLQVINRVSR